MSYDLYAVKKDAKVKELTIGAFSWPMYLQDTGAGYVLGYGAGRNIATYVYRNDQNKASPVSNDGYKVTSSEAKMMAVVIRGYISVQKFVNKEWDEIEPIKRKSDEEYNESAKIFRSYLHNDHLEKLEKIADFMEQSGGFKIK